MPTIRTAAGKGAELTPTEADTNMKRPVTAVTSTPVTLTEAHNRNIIECGTGSGTLALTAAATLAAIDTEDWFVDIVNTTSSAITIDPNGSETIDGANTYTIEPGGSVRVFLNAAKTGFRTSGINASTYIKSLLDDADAAAARATLGVSRYTGTAALSVASNNTQDVTITHGLGTDDVDVDWQIIVAAGYFNYTMSLRPDGAIKFMNAPGSSGLTAPAAPSSGDVAIRVSAGGSGLAGTLVYTIRKRG